jgi:hypothetical protein
MGVQGNGAMLNVEGLRVVLKGRNEEGWKRLCGVGSGVYTLDLNKQKCSFLAE